MVRSFAECRQAEHTAWNAAGVTSAQNLAGRPILTELPHEQAARVQDRTREVVFGPIR